MGDPNYEQLFLVDVSDPVFRECLRAVLEAIDEVDFTRGALHYHTVAMGWPAAWGEKKVPCYVHGGHAMYNDVL